MKDVYKLSQFLCANSPTLQCVLITLVIFSTINRAIFVRRQTSAFRKLNIYSLRFSYIARRTGIEECYGETRTNSSIVFTIFRSISDFFTPQQITGFWAREANHRWEEPTTFYSSNLKGECGVEDKEEFYEDPVLFDPHLEYECELLKTDCFG
uniref:Uncharacterized protein n=1 Tax=Romanomermis culicivorax TaxID=13658 RepID=A0A915KD85_ROMCU